jgi:hypothetical protein
MMRDFHELIADTDFNMTNVLITKDWNICGERQGRRALRPAESR